LPEERVCLGKKPQDDECQYAVLTMRVRYRVVDPVEACFHFARATGNNGDAKAALNSQDLVQIWESQLSVDVAPVLVDDLWGATVGACLAHRLQIQENVRRGLAMRTRRWGVDVAGVTLLDVIPSSP
jgi:regulator of protease activity HflC (stomatin/prohibitin superfamily)